ncbi:MAG: hypothetical protein ACT4OZ_02000 [Gemmatimonadota bacterium]
MMIPRLKGTNLTFPAREFTAWNRDSMNQRAPSVATFVPTPAFHPKRVLLEQASLPEQSSR